MIYVIEEHNEAFYIISKYNSYSNNILVHVDEHHDMAPAYIDYDLLQKKDYRRITYDNLRISDYILALCAMDKIFQVYRINNKNKPIDTIKSVESTNILNFKSFYFSDNINSKYIKIKSTNLDIPRNNLIFDKSKKYILSIDLDYFCSNNLDGETYSINITKDYYEDFVRNKYNPMRLNFGSKVRAYHQENKYYLEICELDGEYNVQINDKYFIDLKINKFLDYIKSLDISFEDIIICKSKLSSFTEARYADYIYSKVSDGLKNIFNINESVYIGEIND